MIWKHSRTLHRGLGLNPSASLSPASSLSSNFSPFSQMGAGTSRLASDQRQLAYHGRSKFGYPGMWGPWKGQDHEFGNLYRPVESPLCSICSARSTQSKGRTGPVKSRVSWDDNKHPTGCHLQTLFFWGMLTSEVEFALSALRPCEGFCTLGALSLPVVATIACTSFAFRTLILYIPCLTISQSGILVSSNKACFPQFAARTESWVSKCMQQHTQEGL